MLICLAITCGLIGLLFLYIRQKLMMYDARINAMADLVQTIAQEITGPVKTISIDVESSKSDSDSDTECESECESECKVECKDVFPEIVIDLVQDYKISVSEDEVVKTVVIDLKNEYDNLTVKELKEKVAALRGPNLKTRKTLLEFLENKM